ncbi:hypothetical protein PSEUBRA_001243 [Kalmanozyma brasiliensis GHG001]|uniref:uncharacterized protein n=1 Tax=Kalmanozyma brasiliensis (strain GHG001) TaxID=1365824 RepID=UPI0028681BA9|nr:uncharacterized protein PSEUBRA_001243 [Kalmanozyma brasiliensis GHG001]KAF6766909.1 hypothetical protein PSEUBRA_001243 [Kalmanozyma brasiliensis GHG001]
MASAQRQDDSSEMHRPRLCDILYSLNKMLHLTHEAIDSTRKVFDKDGKPVLDDNGKPVLVPIEENKRPIAEGFQRVINSRALRALLYYPAAQRLAARSYDERHAIYGEWAEVQSMRTPQRPEPAAYIRAERFVMNLDAGHDIDHTTNRTKLTCAYPSMQDATSAAERLKDYLQDVRLSALGPYDISGVWYHLEGQGNLAKRYWDVNTGLEREEDDDNVRLLNIVDLRGVALDRCPLSGLKQDIDECPKYDRLPCVQISTGMKASLVAFQHRVMALLPHDYCT